MNIIKTAADLMALAALTAPKAKGQDYVEIKVITEPEAIAFLASEMQRYYEETGKKIFQRDGRNIKNCRGVLLLAVKGTNPAELNCGACGVSQCSLLHSLECSEFAGPLCAWRLIDLGIALGSAAKTAGILNVDNRIMYSAGVVARKIGLIQGDIAVAIPLSAGSKNIFFDRAPL